MQNNIQNVWHNIAHVFVVRMPCIPRLDDTYALRNVVDYAAHRHGVTAHAILQPFIVELDMGATVAQLSVFLCL